MRTAPSQRRILLGVGLIGILALTSCQEKPVGETRPLSTFEREGNTKEPAASATFQRFVFPQSSGNFQPASIALDTQTGQLCKTYEWKQSSGTDLPFCSSLATYGLYELHVRKYDEKTGSFEPVFDPFDPLGVFSRTDKAKLTLTEPQIRRASVKYGLSYDEAVKGARESGYRLEMNTVNGK